MPRVKPLIEKKGEAIVRLLWGQMALQGVSARDAAEKAGMNPATLSRRKKSPEKFTLDELFRLGRVLHVPIDDMRQAMRY